MARRLEEAMVNLGPALEARVDAVCNVLHGLNSHALFDLTASARMAFNKMFEEEIATLIKQFREQTRDGCKEVLAALAAAGAGVAQGGKTMRMRRGTRSA